jgi:hypothetical protein
MIGNPPEKRQRFASRRYAVLPEPIMGTASFYHVLRKAPSFRAGIEEGWPNGPTVFVFIITKNDV